MRDFEAKLKGYQQIAENALEQRFTEKVPYQVLFDAMRYSLLAGGKRIRPVLLLAFCEAVGGDPTAALPAAVALEMVHTYSLIHDDLPCMDDDDFRRGRPTNHKIYGEDVATLAGDGLLTEAFLVLTELLLPSDAVLRCVQILSRAAGPEGMVAGQILDMEGERRTLSEPELTQMCGLKTGALLSAACKLGAVIGGGSKAAVEAAERYGMHLGLAFQIRDDMLDAIGTQEELGKPIGSDEENGKSTYLRLLGFEACEKRAGEETDLALRYLCSGPIPDTAFLEALTLRLLTRMK